ncbi:hypothetical protein SK128_012860, partial [Halocaridina rubra]
FEGEAISGASWRAEVEGAYGDLSTRLEQLHNLLLDLRLPTHGLTKINVTFHANERENSLVTHVSTQHCFVI